MITVCNGLCLKCPLCIKWDGAAATGSVISTHAELPLVPGATGYSNSHWVRTARPWLRLMQTLWGAEIAAIGCWPGAPTRWPFVLSPLLATPLHAAPMPPGLSHLPPLKDSYQEVGGKKSSCHFLFCSRMPKWLREKHPLDKKHTLGKVQAISDSTSRFMAYCILCFAFHYAIHWSG